MKTIDKIRKARAGLVLDHPFFGSLALRQEIIIDDESDTAWTDGSTIGFNSHFVDSIPIDQLKTVIAHEVLHIGLSHHARRQNRDPKKWNSSCDYAVNNLLIDSKFSFPPGALIGFPGMSAEEIYSKIPEPPENTGNDPGKMGEVRDAKGKNGNASPAEMAAAEAEAKATVAQAAQQAKAMGKLSESLKRFVDEMLAPKVDWREVLKIFVNQSSKNDYSWTPPNRRYIYKNIYLPSLRSNELGEIVVAVDTSGSVSSRELNEFSAELTAIIEETPATVTVIYCDSKIKNVESFQRDDLPIVLKPSGGGGTNFIPPFDYVSENQMIPSCLIYLTDGECNRFPDEPDYPVIWAITQKIKFSPPFGETIIIKDI